MRKIISFLLEQRGFQLAIPPVLEMIERTLDGDRVDFETQASELYEAVGTMELTLDPVEIDAAAALLESWHSLPRAEVAQRLQSGYLLLRRSFLSELNVNTRRFLEQPNPGKLFWHWLEGLQQRYRKWLTDLNQIPQRLTNR